MQQTTTTSISKRQTTTQKNRTNTYYHLKKIIQRLIITSFYSEKFSKRSIANHYHPENVRPQQYTRRYNHPLPPIKILLPLFTTEKSSTTYNQSLIIRINLQFHQNKIENHKLPLSRKSASTHSQADKINSCPPQTRANPYQPITT